MLPIIFLTKLNLGGIERICVNLCNEWTSQEKDFRLYVSYDGGKMKNMVHAQQNIIVSNTPARFAVVKLYRLCKSHPDSPLLIMNAEIGVVLLLLRFLRLIKNKIVFMESTAILSHCSWKWLQLYRFVISHTDGIIAQSKQGVADLQTLFRVNRRASIVYNPCEFVLRRPHNAFVVKNKNHVRLLMLSRLTPVKGHKRLLNALSRVQRDRWQLSIVGDGENKQCIYNEITRLGMESQVDMLGAALDVRKIYEDSDIFILASAYEGLPNTVIEAIACGCRVLIVKGDGGTFDFLKLIGLEDYVFDDKEFDENFETCLNKVLASDKNIWVQALERMTEVVSPKVIGNQIWRILGSL